MRISVFLIAFFAAVPQIGAQATPHPIVVKGLDALGSGHCRTAIDGWTSTWVGEDTLKRTKLLNGCDLLDQLGTVAGYDVLRTIDVTPHIQRVYVVLRCQNQPVYFLVVAYASQSEWKIVTVTWNTDPDKVLSPEILPRQHPGS